MLGLEQFELGHVRGESQDHSRIIRLSYHTPEYVELAKHAYAAWAELEQDAGEQLVLKTGGLDFAPRESAIPLTNYSGSMDAAGVAYEHLDAAEIRRRWPQFTVTDDIHGLFQPESGIAMAARGNAAHLRMARAHGATLLRPRAGRADPAGGRRDRGDARAARPTAAAGWSSPRAPGPTARSPTSACTCRSGSPRSRSPTSPPPHQAEFQPDRFPIWIWMDDPCFYGFPIFGEAGPKAGQDAGGEEVTAETRTFEPDRAALERTVAFLGKLHPQGAGARSSTPRPACTP